METLGFKRSQKVQDKIDRIIENEEPFFEIIKKTKELYAISNRVTSKTLSERLYTKDEALKVLKGLTTW